MKKPGLENSPSVTMSMPHSACLRDAVGHRFRKVASIGLLVVGLAAELRLHDVEQIVRPRQAADMRGLDAIGVLLNCHVRLLDPSVKPPFVCARRRTPARPRS